MSYPKIFLTRPWRRGIFYGLIVLFFVISPAIILYTAGYRYDWATKRIQATGVLSIDVSPRNTTVRLGDSPIALDQAQTSFLNRDMASYELKNRAPGTYRLTLTNQGYHSWVKDISIQSNQTTYVRDVRLLPKTLPIKLTNLEFGIESIHTSPSGRYILLLSKDENLSTASMYDTERDTLEPLIRDQATLTSYGWSSRSDEFALLLSSTSSDRILLFRADQEFAPITFTFDEPERITYVVWPDSKSRDRAELFVANTSTIFALFDGQKTARHKAPTGTWAFDHDGEIWTTEHGKVVRLLNDRVSEEYDIPFDHTDAFLLITDTHLLLRSDNQVFYISRQNNERRLFREVYDTHVNPASLKTYLASDSELWTITSDGTFTLLNRLGSAIKSLSPIPRFSSIGLLTDNKVVLIREDDLVTTELFSGPNLEKLLTTDRGNYLTFLFSLKGEPKQLYTLPLIQ